MAVKRNYPVQIPLILSIIMLFSSCCGDPPAPVEQNMSEETINFEYAIKDVIFNPTQKQNYSKFISSDYYATWKDSVPAEYRTLQGLAHLYQGELFEITSQILAQMQLDIYEGSDDLAHGGKFPINYKNLGHHDEMEIWRGIDASEIYGITMGRSIFSRVQDNKYSDIISKIESFYKKRSNRSIYNNTFLRLKAGRDILINQSVLPSLALQIELEDIYKAGNYTDLLSRIQDILGEDVFPDEAQFIYFNSMIFKLAALCHYQLGMENLERSFNDTLSLPDSSVYRIIAIMNLARQYSNFEQPEKVKKIWLEKENILVSNNKILSALVETHQRKPYSIDWMFFLEALYMNIPNFTIPPSLAHLDYRNDIFSTNIMKFLANSRIPEMNPVTKDIIDQILKTPSLIDKYPTIMSIFIQELNLSPLSQEYKLQIQEISELLVFNVAHSSDSWHRNRPAFLISLYGTLRWSGSRLPNCNGFLLDLVERFPPMISLVRITNLFTQQILNAKANPKMEKNT